MMSQKPHREVFRRGYDNRVKCDDRSAKKRTKNCFSSRENTGDPEQRCVDGVEGVQPCRCGFRREGVLLMERRNVIDPYGGWGGGGGGVAFSHKKE